jgi:hypothetical protein
MSIEDCETALRRAADELQPLLEPLGFAFRFDQAAQGHQAFAAGFFVCGELRIGLIYRVSDRLGSVSFENGTTSESLDGLMSWLGLAAESRSRYDERISRSVALDGGDVLDALRADLATLSPILRDREKLSRSIVEARRESDRIAADAAARDAAKLQAWLERRRSRKE